MKLILVLSYVAAVLAAPSIEKSNHSHMKNVSVKSLHSNVHPGSRIINGNEAVPHSIPYQVMINQKDRTGSSWSCGGILISTKYVLTAGSCGIGVKSATVLLGAHNIDKHEASQVAIKVKTVHVHEEFKFDSELILNDIAVYGLETEAPLNSNIQPAILPSRGDVTNTYVGQTGKVSGWGVTEILGINPSPVLLYVEDNVITNSECTQKFGSNYVHHSTVCLSGQNNRLPCNGDAGDPLSVDGIVVGISSFQSAYCSRKYPSGFTRVTDFLDWIEESTDVVIG